MGNNLYSNLVNFYNVNDENFKEFMAELYKEMLTTHRDVQYVKEHLTEEIEKILDKYLVDGNFNINIEEKVNEFLENNQEIKNINSQLDTKTNKSELANVQNQINSLVLGAVGDGNNAEVVQARNGYDVINDRLNIYDYLSFKNANELSDEKLNEIDNHFISTTGDLPSDINYATSGEIKVEVGDVIIYEGFVDDNVISVGGWKNGKFVKKISSNIYGVKTQNAYVCDGTYDSIFCCHKKGYDYSFKIIRNKEKNNENSNIVHVGKGEYYKYNEIQDAINNITDDNENNYYTIIVHEGIYTHFYTWVYGLKPRGTKRYINIIGIDKDRCIVNSKFNSTFESNGLLMNLSMINNNEELDISGLELNKDYDSAGRYALHIDYNCHKNIINIINCRFTSVKGSSIGIGLWSEDEIKFTNCEFECYSSDKEKSAIYFHNCGVAGTLHQKIKFKNCTAYSDSYTSVRIQNAVSNGANSEMECEFINCVCYSKTNGYDSIGVLGFNGFGDKGITLSELSFGNSSTLLNSEIGNGGYITLS